jgi:hypothetical protein
VEAEGAVGVELLVVEELVAGALAGEGGLLQGVGEQLIRHVRGEHGLGHDQGAVAGRLLVGGDRERLRVLDVPADHRLAGQAGVEPLQDLGWLQRGGAARHQTGRVAQGDPHPQLLVGQGDRLGQGGGERRRVAAGVQAVDGPAPVAQQLARPRFSQWPPSVQSSMRPSAG